MLKKLMLLLTIALVSSSIFSEVTNALYQKKVSQITGPDAAEFLHRFFPEHNVTLTRLNLRNHTNTFTLSCEMNEGRPVCLITTSSGGISGDMAQKFLGSDRRRELSLEGLEVVCSYSNQNLAYCNIHIAAPVLRSDLGA